jgi:signal transduction histidine kinase
MTSGPVRLERAGGDDVWSPRVEGRFPFPADSVAAAPLEGDSGPIGAIGVFAKRHGRPFTEADLRLLVLIGANVSTAVRLYRASVARERSERLTTIGRLLSQVVHDFKTPMTAISGYVQLLVDEESRARRREHAQQVLRQFEVIGSMQREVLEFARGDRKTFIRKVYLRQFMEEFRRQIEHELAGANVDLEMDVDTKVVARFDEGRVARALHNLVRNAVEAMSEKGGAALGFAPARTGTIWSSPCPTRGAGFRPRSRGACSRVS